MMYHYSIYWIDKSRTSVKINSGVSQSIIPFRFCQQKSMVSIQLSGIFRTHLELLLLLRQRHTTFSTRIFVWKHAKGTTLTLPSQLSQQYDNHKKTRFLWHLAIIVHLQVWLFNHLQTSMCPHLLWKRSTKISHGLSKRYWKWHCESGQCGLQPI